MRLFVLGLPLVLSACNSVELTEKVAQDEPEPTYVEPIEATAAAPTDPDKDSNVTVLSNGIAIWTPDPGAIDGISKRRQEELHQRELVSRLVREVKLRRQRDNADRHELLTEILLYRALENKRNPTMQDIKNLLLLDGRIGVKRGRMTVEEYEEHTGQQY